MQCPKCKKDTYVVDSRDIDSTVIRRRRECDSCGYRFTTFERLEPVNITVIKRDGTEQVYSREKIQNGIGLACQKRKVCEQDICDIVDRIELKIMETGKNPIASKKIGDIVVRELKKVDDVAYLRFASVYKSFASVKSFEKEMARLDSTSAKRAKLTK